MNVNPVPVVLVVDALKIVAVPVVFVFAKVAPFDERLVVDALTEVIFPMNPLVNDSPDPERLVVDALSAERLVVDAVIAAKSVAVALLVKRLVVDAVPAAKSVVVALVITAFVAKRFVIVDVPKVEVPAVSVEKSP